MKVELDINIEDARWESYLAAKNTPRGTNLEDIEEIIEETLEFFPNIKALKEIQISVLLTDSPTMQGLNKQFRGKDKPTNVLSFPEIDLKPGDIIEFAPEEDPLPLGDIALSYNVIADESSEGGISFHAHCLHLFVHSILHLLGFDHTENEDAEQMEEIEIAILLQFGVKSPYK